jgi:hypothetical protein
MELIYVAAAIMMGLGGMGAAIGVGIQHDSPSWRLNYKALSSWVLA